MYDFYKEGSGVGLGHCSIQYGCQLYTTQQMYDFYKEGSGVGLYNTTGIVPSNMAANYIQHNRCMYDFYKEGSGVGLGHCSIQYGCQLYTTQQMYV